MPAANMGVSAGDQIYLDRAFACTCLLPTWVPVQVINCNLRSDETRKQVFGELRTLRSCRHRKIVRYYESFYDNGAVTIAMEYMDRGSLADLFTSFRHVPEHFLAMMMAQVGLMLSWPLMQ